MRSAFTFPINNDPVRLDILFEEHGAAYSRPCNNTVLSHEQEELQVGGASVHRTRAQASLVSAELGRQPKSSAIGYTPG